VRGLLAVDMVQTAKGVIENMLDNIIDHGFVPNGVYICATTCTPTIFISHASTL
jgi:hypothetical protein